ncbi:MAG: T9SS type A sorting domain-containing protein, partial [candidate division Zixibacteria bacterium]
GDGGDRLVAVGYGTVSDCSIGAVQFFSPEDVNSDGIADIAPGGFSTSGCPGVLSFGNRLFVLTFNKYLYRIDTRGGAVAFTAQIPDDQLHGICRIGDSLVVMGGDEVETRLHFVADDGIRFFGLGGYYQYGPITVDVNRDGKPEVAAFSDDGDAILVTIDPTATPVTFEILASVETGYRFTTNPTAGDIDRDGKPDVVIGGENAVYAFNEDLVLLTEFPLEVNDRQPFDTVRSALVVADIDNRDGLSTPELVFPTEAGNLYSFGLSPSYGFPLPGGDRVAGSAMLFSDDVSGYTGYLGSDGWFYLWHVDVTDSSTHDWPVEGADAERSFAFDTTTLVPLKSATNAFSSERFYNYPNPVTDGSTFFRYFLSAQPDDVTLTIYDFSGQEIARIDGASNSPGIDNEVNWDCSGITPGVYRCIIEVDYGGEVEHAFTDVAIIR